ncbi:MAG: uroporphyrinogen-III synthase [Pseudomonadota bacterium]
MPPLILNTRPVADSEGLLTALQGYGYRTLSAPMLEIVLTPRTTDIDLSGVQALVFTSANGVRAFVAASDQRDLPVLSVGDATARMARKAGFDDIQSAGGDIQDLAALITAKIDPHKGALYHPAASQPAGDLAIMLAEAGYEIRRETLYEAQPVNDFSPEVLDALTRHQIDAVLFFSPRTAQSFVKVVAHYKMDAAIRHIQAFCLSQAVKDRLSPLIWQEIHVARQPTQEHLLLTLASVIA